MFPYPDINRQRPFGRIAEAQPDRVTMRLLVIEDDRDAADYLVKAFREVGHVADAATDGDDGLAMALGGQYDVLIVDRMLPKRDGLAVIGALRAKGTETPALILSALGQVDDRAKGLRVGGDDYLPKPYSFSELLARVEVLARRPVAGAKRLCSVSAISSSIACRTKCIVGRMNRRSPRISAPRVSDGARGASCYSHYAVRKCVGLPF